IHIGRTEGADRARPFASIGGTAEGAISADGRVQGSYLHGLFSSDDFRRAWLARLGISSFGEGYSARIESALDALAGHIEQHLYGEGTSALARGEGAAEPTPFGLFPRHPKTQPPPPALKNARPDFCLRQPLLHGNGVAGLVQPEQRRASDE